VSLKEVVGVFVRFSCAANRKNLLNPQNLGRTEAPDQHFQRGSYDMGYAQYVGQSAATGLLAVFTSTADLFFCCSWRTMRAEPDLHNPPFGERPYARYIGLAQYHSNLLPTQSTGVPQSLSQSEGFSQIRHL
jgi:hypothetical protein